MKICCHNCGEPLDWRIKTVPLVDGNYFCVECFVDHIVKVMSDKEADKFEDATNNLRDEEVIKRYAEEWVDYDFETWRLESIEEFKAVEAKSGYYEFI